uniref:Uncharacterized protein n=1 Tax=Panagrellus redivivus TaxID=6233 RepID=A0A7E4W0H2_PANRE
MFSPVQVGIGSDIAITTGRHPVFQKTKTEEKVHRMKANEKESRNPLPFQTRLFDGGGGASPVGAFSVDWLMASTGRRQRHLLCPRRE